MITLNDLPLSPDLVWVDEFAWSHTKFSPKYTLGKTITVNVTQLNGNTGRPLTLQADYAWMQRADILAVQKLLDTNTEELTLVLHDNRTFQVIPVNDCFKATPLQDNPEPSISSWYSVIFNFIILK